MLADTAQFFLDMLVEPYAILLLFRFHLHWLRAPLRNPLGDFVCLLTNPLVLPLRRLLPAYGRVDTATLVLAFGFETLYLALLLLLHNTSALTWVLPVWALFSLFKLSIYLLIFALFVQALLSWTYPNAPFAPLLHTITFPFLRPFRRMVPPKGGLDFSFLILFFLCYLLVALPLRWTELLIMELLPK